MTSLGFAQSEKVKFCELPSSQSELEWFICELESEENGKWNQTSKS